MASTSVDREITDGSGPEGISEADNNLAQNDHVHAKGSNGSIPDFLRNYKIPEKSSVDSDSEGEISDPYENEDNDHSSSENESEVESDVGPTRYDPLVNNKQFALDKSKEKYAQNFFNTHIAEDVIKSEILKLSPIPVNTFLCPPECDEFIEDMIYDETAMRVLKLQDHSLVQIQKKLSQIMGPLSKLCMEVDSNDFSQTKPSIDMFDLKELIEKTILLIGQTNATCLYERRLNFLAKIMSSVKKAKVALKENESEFRSSGSGNRKLFGTFYNVMDRKAKSRKRARELSRNIKEPPAKRPFQKGPSEKKGHSRGSFQKPKAGKKGEWPKRRTGFKPKQNRYVDNESKPEFASNESDKRKICFRDYVATGVTTSNGTGNENKNGPLQSPPAIHRYEISRNRTKSNTFRRKTVLLSSKLEENNFRSEHSGNSKRLQNKIHRGTPSEKRTEKQYFRERFKNI